MAYAKMQKAAAAQPEAARAILAAPDAQSEAAAASAVQSFSTSKEGAISFTAFVLREIKPKFKAMKPGSHLLSFMPLDVHRLLAEDAPSVALAAGASVPLYEAATADHAALRLNVYVHETPKMGTNKKDKECRALDHAAHGKEALVANYHEILTSIFESDDKDKEKEGGAAAGGGAAKSPDELLARGIPGALMFVQVRGYMLKWAPAKLDKDGEETPGHYFCSVAALDAAPFADVNALPEEDRLALALAPAHQRLPELLPLTAFAEPARAATAHLSQDPANKNALARAKEAALKPWLPPLPVIPLHANRAWAFGVFAPSSVDVPIILPMRGFPAAEPQRLLQTVQIAAGDGLEHPKGIYGNFEFDAITTEQGAETAKHRLRAILFLERFAGLGVSYPHLLQPLLAHHPVPFIGIAEMNVVETVENGINRQRERSVYMPDGVISLSPFATVVWRLREYLERCGIPVTRALVQQRYGGTGMAQLESDCKAPLRNDKFKNPYEASNAFKTLGLASFDSDNIRKLPAEKDGARYYALPLMDVIEPLKRAPRADPACAMPLVMQPPAVDLTPAEGDAYVTRALGTVVGTTPDLDDAATWMLSGPGAPPVPRFLFFALEPRAPAPLPVLPFAALPTSAPDAHAASLPADMNAVRRALIAQKLAPPAPAAEPVPAADAAAEPEPDPAATDAAAESKKRARDANDAPPAGAEPDAKQPRLDAAAAGEQQ